ncbi:phosphoribosyltransferase family protein [Alsobacter sp. KACC 23698]|uniref:Phosphoribosyltransferase family protein n=1 Tax=Alsobacter sp. KACC 23698 TaxID=3149229 RepID=A0AAU7JHF6_9HYPH
MFKDRVDAGRRLAAELLRLKAETPLVYGLPRGGVPVAAEVARALGVPLHVLLVRKIGAPGEPELALGAVADGDPPLVVWNEALVRELGLDERRKAELAQEELAVLEQRRRRFASLPPRPSAKGRTAIVIDDGLATGATARAALLVLRAERPARLVLAAPVSSPEAAEELADDADEVVCLEAPALFRGVGASYRDFGQTSEDQVIALVRSLGRRG